MCFRDKEPRDFISLLTRILASENGLEEAWMCHGHQEMKPFCGE